MTRSRASAKAAGTRFERQVADYLARGLDDDRIDRRVKTGSADKGDIGGVRHLGARVVVECKNTSRLEVGPWLTEAEVGRVNDAATVGLVVAKRHGKGAPADRLVLMTLGDLVALLNGNRDHLVAGLNGVN